MCSLQFLNSLLLFFSLSFCRLREIALRRIKCINEGKKNDVIKPRVSYLLLHETFFLCSTPRELRSNINTSRNRFSLIFRDFNGILISVSRISLTENFFLEVRGYQRAPHLALRLSVENCFFGAGDWNRKQSNIFLFLRGGSISAQSIYRFLLSFETI